MVGVQPASSDRGSVAGSDETTMVHSLGIQDGRAYWVHALASKGAPGFWDSQSLCSTGRRTKDCWPSKSPTDLSSAAGARPLLSPGRW